MTAVLVERGRDDQFIASGFCNVELQRLCSEKSQYPIASNTKFFTGLLAASLVADGEVPQNEPISRKWPEFRLSDSRWSELTLRDLLSQRSGLGSVDWPYFWDESLTLEDYLQRIPAFPMASPFRDRWNYANANFVIAGEYLRRVTGQDWQALMRRKVLEPLGLGDARFVAPDDGTTGYRRDQQGLVPYKISMSSAIGPAGSLVLSARDYGRVLRMFVQDGMWNAKAVVPRSALSMATAITTPMGYDRRYASGPSGYGYGVIVQRYRGRVLLSHSGGAPGFTAHFAILPDDGLAVAVMTNLVGTAFNEAATLDLLDILLDRKPKSGALWLDTFEENHSPPIDGDDPNWPLTQPLLAYVGFYEHPAWGRFQISIADGGLVIEMGGMRRPLKRQRGDSFSFATEPGFENLRLRFEAGFDGQIAGLVLDDAVNPEPMSFHRVFETKPD